MEFKINPDEICNVFVVPASVVDDDLRLAGSTQLKVLLWTLRHLKHENASIGELAQELSIDKADIMDAMQFWLDRGILLKQGSDNPKEKQTVKSSEESVPAANTPVTQPTPVPSTEPTPSLAPQAPTPSANLDLPLSKPSLEQVAIRCRESKELCDLFAEAQTLLGRTIGYDGQSVLLMMYDTYGLPMPVILMALEYAKSQGKTSMKFIASIGKLWSDKEIDTLEKAIEFIEAMNSCDGIWERFRQLTGLTNPKPTASQRSFLVSWTKELGYGIDMIYLAYEEMVDHTNKFSMPYINKTLLNWHAAGLKTTDDVEAMKQERKNGNIGISGKPVPKSKKSEDASYDIDEYERKAMFSAPVYKKQNSDN